MWVHLHEPLPTLRLHPPAGGLCPPPKHQATPERICFATPARVFLKVNKLVFFEEAKTLFSF